jgi:hypothetical protein
MVCIRYTYAFKNGNYTLRLKLKKSGNFVASNVLVAGDYYGLPEGQANDNCGAQV